MLVVMHYRNGQLLTQALFNYKTLRCFYVFQVYSSEGGFQGFYDLYKFFRIIFIDLDIKNVDIGKYFEQYSFSLHHRLAGLWTYIAQAQNGSAITDHSNQIPF